MHDTALYFPYIRPPDNAWFRQMALYWDSIGAIVPHDYKNDPHSAPHFETLIETGLLQAVRPMDHLRYQYEFGGDFLAHVEKKASAERESPKWTKLLPYRSLIHAEKLDYLGGELCRLGLAQQVNYSWYDLEGWVAAEFMSYLACVIGRSSASRLLPITNDQHCAALITGALPNPSAEQPRPADAVREVFLDAIVPSPGPDVSFEEIAVFKNQHRDQLSKFRRMLETEILIVASISPADARAWVAQEKATALREQSEELTAKMRERWPSVLLGTFFPLVAAGAQMLGANVGEASSWVSSVAGLGGAGYAVRTGVREAGKSKSDPLAYAVHLKKTFG
ncbi:MAG TPA: DUF6236 family protein [Sphingomicrobium sp.]|nr:DUF6236 family protein [Sphingomicrobium sp.]